MGDRRGASPPMSGLNKGVRGDATETHEKYGRTSKCEGHVVSHTRRLFTGGSPLLCVTERGLGRREESFTWFPPDREHPSRTHYPKSQDQRLELQTDSQKTGRAQSRERQSRGDVGNIVASLKQ